MSEAKNRLSELLRRVQAGDLDRGVPVARLTPASGVRGSLGPPGTLGPPAPGDGKAPPGRATLAPTPGQRLRSHGRKGEVLGYRRRWREGHLSDEEFPIAWERLQRLKSAWQGITPREAVRRNALRLVRTYPLRTLDAPHRAALQVLAEDNPEGVPLVCLDQGMARAAALEGFSVRKPV